MQEISDKQLIGQTLAGNMRAYGQLVARHQDRVFRFLMGMLRNRSTAEDLTQDAFVKAARHLGTLKNHASFGAWVLSIARNLALDWLRSAPPAWRELEQTNIQGAGTAASETRLLVRRALSEMTQQDKEILLLVDLLGLSIQELTEHFSLSPSATKMRISRARKRFRRLFQQLSAGEDQEGKNV